MKNRVLLLAAAGALASPLGHLATNAPTGPQATPLYPQAQGGLHAPQGRLGTLLQAMLGTGGGLGGGPVRPNYRRGGYTVAQGKRAARKRRNVLRAHGHHRQAVR